MENLLSGPQRSQKLIKIFLRIYETFQNSQKLLQLTQELSGSGRIPNSLLKVRVSMIWLNTQYLVFATFWVPNSYGRYGKVQENFPRFS
jgi:hypothetical protein